MKKVLVLYKKSHFSGFVNDLYKELSIDEVIYISPGQGDGLIYLKNKINSNCELHIIILDYRPLVFAQIISWANSCSTKISYVQHGFIEISQNRSFHRKTLSWFFEVIYFSYLFLIYGDLRKSFFGRIFIIFDYLKNGGAKSIKRCSRDLKLHNAFVFDNDSKFKFSNEFLGKVNHIVIVGSLEKDKILYDESGGVLYVSQPLYKTGHTTKSNYLSFLQNKFNNHSEIYFLAHPKIDHSFTENLPSNFIIISKTSLHKYRFKLVYGHFSSMLLSINIKIELKLIDKIKNDGLEEVKNFDPYKTKNINGYELIKKILSD